VPGVIPEKERGGGPPRKKEWVTDGLRERGEDCKLAFHEPRGEGNASRLLLIYVRSKGMRR